jgi:hypothetical protein
MKLMLSALPLPASLALTTAACGKIELVSDESHSWFD